MKPYKFQPYLRTTIWGEANINGIRVKQGETLLVPASENVLYIFGNATFLTATM